ncbi:MAG: hypothetical protein GQ536_00685 [Candidatus Aminicenantes bacterium]|nr:hypothetical protein [Candidatus Aminicenantes bacterium]
MLKFISIFKAKVLGMDDVTIEGLAFGAWPLREADEVSQRLSVEKTVNKAEQALFFSHLLLFTTRFWGIAIATIEDLAFGIRSSRGPDGVGQRVCLSVASYAAAEKSEWRIALKNLKGSKAIPQNLCQLRI